jgi:hypothetical protein
MQAPQIVFPLSDPEDPTIGSLAFSKTIFDSEFQTPL